MAKLTVRQYLRNLDKPTLRKLFDLADLTEEEKWLLIYAFVERRMVENTCYKLGISKGTYHNKLNVALIKVHYTIKELDKIYTL